MKKRVWFSALLLLMALLLAFTGCRKNPDDDGPVEPEENREKVEQGVYYYDAGTEEYLITIDGSNNVAFIVKGDSKVGTVEKNGEELTFIFADGTERLSATLKEGVLSFTYKDSAFRMLEKVNRTVSFNAMGGSEVAGVTVTNGKTAAKPADPVREGYTFAGWYTSEDLKTTFRFDSDLVMGNITLYARWIEPGQSEFTIDFKTDNENEVIDSRVTVGGKLDSLPEVAARDGYTFLGWWVCVDGDASKPSYPVNENTVFTEKTTLIALWSQNTASGNKLPTPVVQVSSKSIVWDGNDNAKEYIVTIRDEAGRVVHEVHLGTRSAEFDFDREAPGEYTVSVVAVSATNDETDNSEPAVRYFKNRTLAKVSNFSVVEPSILLFEGVPNAEYYLITVYCGNPDHKHTEFYNGTSTNYQFANCPMTKGGIRFVVTAVADGYASSVSDAFVYDRTLAPVTTITVNEEKQILNWSFVPGALKYVVTIHDGTGDHTVYVEGTSLDLKGYAPVEGGIVITVTPETKGYNSPEACQYVYNKTALQTPGNVGVAGNLVTWDAVEGATSYEVRVNSVILTADTNSLDIARIITQQAWTMGSDNEIQVRAIGGVSSAWTDVLKVRYMTMYDTVTYSNNTVKWRPVAGVVGYRVQVNGGAEITVGNNVTSLEVTLTKGGINTISVRCFDNDIQSNWVSVEVWAHTVTFDSRAGSSAGTQYLASGDRVKLPETAKGGYVFAGWYNTPGGAQSNGELYADATFSDVGDIVLYAYWLPEAYKVNFDYGVGSGSGMAGEAWFESHYQFEVPTPPDFSVAFAGWYTGEGGIGTQLTDEHGKSVAPWNFIGETTVYAKWAAVLKFEELDNGTYRVTAGSGISYVTSVFVPDSYEGKPITELKSYAFSSKTNLVSISVPDTMVEMQAATAFSGCKNLQNVEVRILPDTADAAYRSDDGVLLYHRAQTGTWELAYYPQARSGFFRIPSYVSHIPKQAFSGSALSAVVIPTSVVEIGEKAFYNCKNLVRIEFEMSGTDADSSIGADLEILQYAFQNCTAVETIVLPARTLEFNNNVFSGCSKLRSIDIEEKAGQYLFSMDGLLCNALKDTILYCPAGRSGEYVVPVTINTIGTRAFSYCTKLTKIELPPYLTTIEQYAFEYCSRLETVVFTAGEVPVTVTVGNNAFTNCKALTKVTFEEGTQVKTLGNYTFYSCSALQEIELPGTITTMGNYVFGYCSSLQDIRFAPAADESTELTIGNYFFYNCTSLESVTLPAHLKSFGTLIFDGCKMLDNVMVDENSQYYANQDGVLYDKDITSLIYYPPGKTDDFTLPDTVVEITANVFKNNTSLSRIYIGAQVKNIGKQAFYACQNLKEVIFAEAAVATADGGEEKDVITIGEQAFYNCPALTRVVLSSRVEVLPKECFRGCVALSDVTFVEGLTEFGSSVFYDCVALTEAILPESLTTVSGSTFRGCVSLETLYVPSSVETVSASMVYGCTSLKNVTICEGVTIIDSYAFCQCYALESIVIPSTVFQLGSDVFQNCTALSEITFTERVAKEGGEATEEELPLLRIGYLTSTGNEWTSAGGGAFESCTALTSIHFPAHLQKLGAYSLGNCSNLKEITFAENSRLEYIGNRVFEKLPIETITLPGSLKTMGTYIFSACPELTTVIFGEGGTEPLYIGNAAFNNCTALETVVFSSTVADFTYKTAETQAFIGCTALKTVTVPATNTYIVMAEDGAIYNAAKTRLLLVPAMNGKNITVPATVTTIAKQATRYYSGTEITFADGIALKELPEYCFAASSLTKITIPASVTTMGNYVFSNSLNLAEVTFEAESKLTKMGTYSFEKTAITSLVIPDGVETMGNGTVAGCSELTEMTLPAKLKLSTNTYSTNYMLSALAAYASNYPPKLENLYISDNATNFKSIDGVIYSKDGKTLVFYPCARTNTRYEIPEGVTTVGMMAFCNSLYLESVTIPNSVTKVDQSAFKSAAKLESVTVLSGRTTDITFVAPTSGSYGAFNGTSLKEFHITKYTKLGKYAFYEVKTLTRVVFDEDCGITSLPDNFFYGCDALKEVRGGSCLKQIGASAFRSCSSLTSVEDLIKNAVQVGENAFYGAGIVTLTIPKGLEKIGRYAFQMCKSLLSVEFEEGHPITAIPGSLFSGCSSLKSIKLPGTITTIDNNAFQNSALETFVVPAGVKALPNYVFQNCKNLKTITLNDVTTIGTYAFTNCESLTEIDLSKVTSIGTNAFQGCTGFETVDAPVATTIGNYAFAGCTNLKSVNIPVVTAIGNYMFQNCSSLEDIELPVSLTTIGTYAFQNCTALTSIYIPAGVTTMAGTTTTATATTVANTFAGCTSLKIVTFDPDSQLTFIPVSAFSGCVELEIIENFPNTATRINKEAFSGCVKLRNITVGPDVTYIGDNAFKNCEALTTINIPESVTTMGANPFVGCVALSHFDLDNASTSFTIENNVLYNAAMTSIISYPCSAFGRVVIPETVTSIGAGVFAGSQVTSVVIPDGIKTIVADTFANCTNLRSVTLPESITSIGARAFQNSALESIIIPANVTSIGESAFEGTALTAVCIPATVTTVGASAFKNCVDLAELTFAEGGRSIMTLGNYAFQGCSALTELVLPSRLRTITSSSGYTAALGTSCFESCTNLKTVVFDQTGAGLVSGVLTLNSYAFRYCSSLESVVFPNFLKDTTYQPGSSSAPAVSLAAVGGYCFADCTSLSNVEFNTLAGKLSFGAYMFQNCKSLKTFELPALLTVLPAYAFQGSGLEYIEIPRTITSFDMGYNFMDCADLKEVVIRSNSSFSVSIASSMFENCTSLEKVVLPECIGTISIRAFAGCVNLKELELPAAVTSINREAFENCTSLNLTVSRNVTTVGQGAFSGWTAAQTLTIQRTKGALPSGWNEAWDSFCDATIQWNEE